MALIIDIGWFILGFIFTFAFGLYLKGLFDFGSTFDFDEWIKDYYDDE